MFGLGNVGLDKKDGVSIAFWRTLRQVSQHFASFVLDPRVVAPPAHAGEKIRLG